MNLAGRILKMAGWEVEVNAPDFPKAIVCVAPHTSNWDFILGKLTYASVGRKAGFLMKSSWFFFPLGYIFKAMGGVPVFRKHKKGSLVEQLVGRFNSTDRLTLAITPEGTRGKVAKWHTGFLQIAFKAHIPVLIGILDYGCKRITVNDVFYPTGDMTADLAAITKYYKPSQAKYPDKFTTGND